MINVQAVSAAALSAERENVVELANHAASNADLAKMILEECDQTVGPTLDELDDAQSMLAAAAVYLAVAEQRLSPRRVDGILR